MKKITFVFLCLIFLFLLFKLSGTFALLESKTQRVVQSDVATWTILVNNTDISDSSTSFTIDKINWNKSSSVKEGKVAPGVSGYFDIVIDPNNTDVSIRYDIVFDFSSLSNTAINVENINETSGNNIVQTSNNKYTGIIKLSDINNNVTNKIRVNLKWSNNEENNEQDYELGKNPNTVLKIPVVVEVSQYTGEEIISYLE